MKLSIIIPLFNEANTIRTVLQELEKLNIPDFIVFKEIIIVDDHSTDPSAEIVKDLIEGKNHIQLIRNEKNIGKGASVRKGIEHAEGDVYVVQDADLELSPEDIPSMLRAMYTLDVEFINGSRYMPGIVRPLASYRRYLMNRIFTWMVSLLINVRLTDMACGYKIIHRNLYDQLHLKEDRFGFEAELIIKALRIKPNNIAEVPVQYFPRSKKEGKKIRAADGFKMLWTIFKYCIIRMK